jgi:hypothetical protein
MNKRTSKMCAQQTATDVPSAGLNIAELADQYTRLVRGIGHQHRLTPTRTGWRKSVEDRTCSKRFVWPGRPPLIRRVTTLAGFDLWPFNMPRATSLVCDLAF